MIKKHQKKVGIRNVEMVDETLLKGGIGRGI